MPSNNGPQRLPLLQSRKRLGSGFPGAFRLLLRAKEKGWIFYRKKSASGTVSGGIGAAMTELDRIVRPSAEYRIQAENPIVEEDEKRGD